MRVLVTGGTGFIGSHLARRLVTDGHEVWVTGTSDEQALSVPAARQLPRDVRTLDWERLGRLDVVFHQAANNDTTDLDRARMFDANVEQSKHLFTSAVARGCRRIVYASSTAVYGDVPAPYREDGPVHPLNPYAESKLALDEWATAFARAHAEVTIVGLRYCNVYGPGEGHKGKRASMVWQLAQQMREGNPRIFRWGEQKRDYCFVEDAVRANLFAAAARQSGIVNCGSGIATTFNDLIALWNATLGLRRVPVYIENPYVGRYQSFTLCDMSRANALLGFVPGVGIHEGIRRTAASGVPAARPGEVEHTLPKSAAAHFGSV